ncbi:DNA-3-methyladenine glycosylase [Saccharibacillus sp. CPCC 101409]|uniref:DNA-3-methyladenine glycosylase n=1 Tax=Saccharibacillus sp. CPCC 101409 TaxID=3058041 RepID=UPI002672055E|nr:DNA-3-methyladenine glycosylase [Saccharibacillus sp. CPCC 101409]MDO3413146.1 DNA-3-methyladenine glycosylase [Saccharibacillus sp. CPCC 101409]
MPIEPHSEARATHPPRGPFRPLPASLFSSAALEASPLLLGQTLVRRTEAGEIRSRIVETESYGGVLDKGSHAYGGRRTARTEIMFGPGGPAYVYLIYGMYHCLNVVTGEADNPQAVLIRAVEPLTEEDERRMRFFRSIKSKKTADLSGGPGKLCRALDIDKSLNGCRLSVPTGPLYLEAGDDPHSLPILCGPRINIDYAEEYAAKPWRFWIKDHAYVSVNDKANPPKPFYL